MKDNLLHLWEGLQQEENEFFNSIQWEKRSSKEKQVSFFNKDLRELFTFNADWMSSMRKELTLFSPFSFPPSCYFTELVRILSQISASQLVFSNTQQITACGYT